MYCHKQMVQLGGGHGIDAGTFVLWISKGHSQLQFISPVLLRTSPLFTNTDCGFLASLQRHQDWEKEAQMEFSFALTTWSHLLSLSGQVNWVKHSVVVTGERKRFLFFFSDSKEHIKNGRSVPQCLCAVGNAVSTALGAILWASGRFEAVQVEPSQLSLRWGLHRGWDSDFCLTFPHSFFFSFFKLSSDGYAELKGEIALFCYKQEHRCSCLLLWRNCKIPAKPNGWALAFALTMMGAGWRRSGKWLGREDRVS